MDISLGKELFLDISHIEFESFNDLRKKLFAHKVVIIERQSLTDGQLLSFAKGTLHQLF